MGTTVRETTREVTTGDHAWLLALISQDLDQRIGAALAPAGLSVEQWRALEHLAGAGPCTMSALGSTSTVAGASLTRLVDHLVEHSLVYRAADTADRRRVLVHLSSRGRRRVRALRPKVRTAEAEAMAALSDQERDDLARLLQQLAPSIDP
ncbi:MarR family winged helix-turn-helix transcriptional regulator [Janibacter corallicola]|uniref:MarR family winged helix-turn-helix transcriptional regulator n=1 Tax=Janibacter corallicola TaxID=415212 RepID=UPI000A529558|nr:MarR family transcriptional regulator [Janibacter corallicola]